MKIRDNDGLHKRPNKPGGIWYFRYRSGDGRLHEMSTGTSVYADAKNSRDKLRAEVREQKPPAEMAKDGLKVGAESYFAYRAIHVAKNTARNDKAALKPLVEYFTATKRLNDFQLEDLKNYQLVRIKSVRARMVNLELSLLRSLLKEANVWHRIGDRYKPLPEDPAEPGRVLTYQEEAILFKALDSKAPWKHVSSAAKLALNTGMRGGEIKKLWIAHLRLEGARPCVEIRRAGTKTDAGVRWIPLNNAGLRAAFELVARAAELGATEPHHHVLPSDNSKHTKPDDPLYGARGIDVTTPQGSFKTVWLRAVEDAGLKGLKFHDLRHTFITRQAEMGTPLVVVMEMVGHMSEEMVRYYTHISDTAMRDAVAKMEARQLEAVRASEQ